MISALIELSANTISFGRLEILDEVTETMLKKLLAKSKIRRIVVPGMKLFLSDQKNIKPTSDPRSTKTMNEL